MEKWNARNSNVFEFLVIFNEIMKYYYCRI